MRNLTITVNDDWKTALREAVWVSEAGLVAGTYQGETLSFATPELLFRRFGLRQWAVVQALLQAGPLFDRELAEGDDIDGNTVTADVEDLIQLGVIERNEKGSVYCPFDHVRIDFLLER